MSDKKQNFQKGFRQKFTKVKTAKGRRASSTRWLQRQLNDPFAILAKQENYRGRAAYKLIEIDNKFQLLKKSNLILDLGCAPGGWLQVIREKNNKAKLIGIDLIEIDPMDGVDFIQGDFTENSIKDKILALTNNHKIDLILSDIAPSTCGHKDTDHIRLINIIEDILLFLKANLKENGKCICKVFFGNELEVLKKEYKKYFKKISFVKPESSRKESKEQFMICTNFKEAP